VGVEGVRRGVVDDPVEADPGATEAEQEGARGDRRRVHRAVEPQRDAGVEVEPVELVELTDRVAVGRPGRAVRQRQVDPQQGALGRVEHRRRVRGEHRDGGRHVAPQGCGLRRRRGRGPTCQRERHEGGGEQDRESIRRAHAKFLPSDQRRHCVTGVIQVMHRTVVLSRAARRPGPARRPPPPSPPTGHRSPGRAPRRRPDRRQGPAPPGPRVQIEIVNDTQPGGVSLPDWVVGHRSPAGQGVPGPPGGWLVVDDCENPAFQVGETVSHGRQPVGRVPDPAQDLADDLDGLAGAATPADASGSNRSHRSVRTP